MSSTACLTQLLKARAKTATADRQGAFLKAARALEQGQTLPAALAFPKVGRQARLKAASSLVITACGPRS